jgi:hypothetical protein
VVIKDITSWHHPVKKIFAKYAIKIDKVQLVRRKTYPVFHVEFPFEPTEGFENARVLSKLEAELFVANGHYDEFRCGHGPSSPSGSAALRCTPARRRDRG